MRNTWLACTEEEISAVSEIRCIRSNDDIKLDTADPSFTKFNSIIATFNSMFGLFSFPPAPSIDAPEIEFESLQIYQRPGNSIEVGSDQIGILLSRKLSLDKQINLIRQQLDKNLFKQSKIHPDKYQNYLRYYDAYTSGAEIAEITRHFKPSPSDAASGYSSERAMHASIKAARRYVEKDYRLISATEF